MVAVLRKVYDGCMVPAKVAWHKRGQQQWKGEGAYNPWTQHQSKELIYLLQKSTSHQKESITRMLLGGQIGRKRPSLVPDRHSLGRQSINKIVLQLHHKAVHHTCMLQESQTSTQAFFIITSTSMTLISLPPYLKTLIKYQIDHSIQFTFYDSFYYTQLGCSSFQDQICNHIKYHAVLKDSKNNISEA